MNLSTLPFFVGLDRAAINDILKQMRPSFFEEGDHICDEGDVGDRMFIIERGLVEVIVGQDQKVVNVIRPGDVVGEMAVLTDEPRSATLIAAMPTLVLELDRAGFADAIGRFPRILLNLTRMLVERQRRTNLRLLEKESRAELVGIVLGHASNLRHVAGAIIDAVRRSTPRTVRIVDVTNALAVEKEKFTETSPLAAIGIVESLRAAAALILVVVHCDQTDVGVLLRYLDRVFVLGDEADVYRSAPALTGVRDVQILLTGTHMLPPTEPLCGFRIAKAIDDADSGQAIAWVGRHITRTKLGLALGAGGAKGFAHIGVLDALHRAGYLPDFVAGSSIGALVSGLFGMDGTIGRLEELLHDIWRPEHVAELATLSPHGISVGMSAVLDGVLDLVRDLTIEQLKIPTAIMSADLQHGEPVSFERGILYEALRAALAVPGLLPPFEKNGRRLVDAVCLTPVPTTLLREMGADIVIAVNLLHRKVVKPMPSELPEIRRPPQRDAPIDPVIETLMMLQTDTSIRNAREADVVLTPRFAPSSWRDFSLAALFQEAGREAAEGQLARLRELACPWHRGGTHGQVPAAGSPPISVPV